MHFSGPVCVSMLWELIVVTLEFRALRGQDRAQAVHTVVNREGVGETQLEVDDDLDVVRPETARGHPLCRLFTRGQQHQVD